MQFKFSHSLIFKSYHGNKNLREREGLVQVKMTIYLLNCIVTEGEFKYLRGL